MGKTLPHVGGEQVGEHESSEDPHRSFSPLLKTVERRCHALKRKPKKNTRKLPSSSKSNRSSGKGRKLSTLHVVVTGMTHFCSRISLYLSSSSGLCPFPFPSPSSLHTTKDRIGMNQFVAHAGFNMLLLAVAALLQMASTTLFFSSEHDRLLLPRDLALLFTFYALAALGLILFISSFVFHLLPAGVARVVTSMAMSIAGYLRVIRRDRDQAF